MDLWCVCMCVCVFCAWFVYARHSLTELVVIASLEKVVAVSRSKIVGQQLQTHH